jgi:hypothetical protein
MIMIVKGSPITSTERAIVHVIFASGEERMNSRFNI